MPGKKERRLRRQKSKLSEWRRSRKRPRPSRKNERRRRLLRRHYKKKLSAKTTW